MRGQTGWVRVPPAVQGSRRRVRRSGDLLGGSWTPPCSRGAMVDASGLGPEFWEFESPREHYPLWNKVGRITMIIGSGRRTRGTIPTMSRASETSPIEQRDLRQAVIVHHFAPVAQR
jgi:hypothetical protein